MARFVLLEFDDNEEAMQQVEIIQRNPDAHEGVEVAGVYFKPTLFCDCSFNRVDGFTRGRKYGIWVHAKCGKPRRTAWSSDPSRALESPALGYNLLAHSWSPPKSSEGSAEPDADSGGQATGREDDQSVASAEGTGQETLRPVGISFRVPPTGPIVPIPEPNSYSDDHTAAFIPIDDRDRLVEPRIGDWFAQPATDDKES